MGEHTERSTLAACVASIVGVPAAEVPLDDVELRAWLGRAALGLVPVDAAAEFSWAGPWIAWRPRSDGQGRAAVVMFGVPSGVVFDPAGTTDEILGGLLPAALDIALWSAGERGDPGTGIVEAIVVAAGGRGGGRHGPRGARARGPRARGRPLRASAAGRSPRGAPGAT